MRTSIVALLVVAAVAAPAATARRTLPHARHVALPHAGVRFNGTTSAKHLNGFGDDMTFLTGGRTLKEFSFGSLGCFGYSSFPVGVDPYATSLVQLRKAVPVTSKGTFTIAGAPNAWGGGDSTVELAVSITGEFTSATAVHGTISVVEHGANGSCGPVKMKFSARAGH